VSERELEEWKLNWRLLQESVSLKLRRLADDSSTNLYLTNVRLLAAVPLI